MYHNVCVSFCVLSRFTDSPVPMPPIVQYFREITLPKGVDDDIAARAFDVPQEQLGTKAINQTIPTLLKL